MTTTWRGMRFVGVAGCAVALLVGITGCAPDPARPGPSRVGVGEQACWPRDRFGNETPSPNRAFASELTAQPIEITASFGNAVDKVLADAVVLDFPQTELADPAQAALVLASTTVSTSDPGGWELGKSMAVITFEDTGGGNGGLARGAVCPLAPAAVAATLRATGREPLPARVEPGQTAHGWVAFVVPRTARVLNLRLQRLDPEGGYGAASYPLLNRPAPACG